LPEPNLSFSLLAHFDAKHTAAHVRAVKVSVSVMKPRHISFCQRLVIHTRVINFCSAYCGRFRQIQSQPKNSKWL